tara:strand:+ start:492 stop:794 length:303 start_codon:yes stop_codon:yes gene_type:complete
MHRAAPVATRGIALFAVLCGPYATATKKEKIWFAVTQIAETVILKAVVITNTLTREIVALTSQLTAAHLKLTQNGLMGTLSATQSNQYICMRANVMHWCG